MIIPIKSGMHSITHILYLIIYYLIVHYAKIPALGLRLEHINMSASRPISLNQSRVSVVIQYTSLKLGRPSDAAKR